MNQGASGFALAVLLAVAGGPASLAADGAKAVALESVDQQAQRIAELGLRIWEFAEPAFQEHRSSRLLADALEEAGFRVKRGVAEMPTAFVAEYGSGKPVVAILAEYDALPGLAQAAVPRRQPAPGSAGHGCGHNLFGAACTGAGIAVKAAIDQHKLPGTVRVYGCPAEEGGAGKAYMIRGGLFDDVDVALHWHPSSSTGAGMKGSLAVVRFRVRFHGTASHAAGSPEKGRSALDGVELMNVGVNYLREHVPSSARIHYVIVRGGDRPNVVPAEAEAWYYICAPKMSEARSIFERVKKIAEGAALMSETRQEIVQLTGSYEILPNEPLARLVDANLRDVGPPPFTDDDRQFAAALREELGLSVDRVSGSSDPLDGDIARFVSSSGSGSTDVGDVSWVVPTAGLNVATAARGCPGHSWANVACAGSSIGSRGSVTAAKVLAASVVELLENPDVIDRAKHDFAARRGSVQYEPLLEPGPPPDRLDAPVETPLP